MGSLSAWVTGGSGFIGRALTKRLIETGWDVTHIARPDSRLNPGATAVRVETLSREALAQAMQGRRCDVLFHLATYGVAPHMRDLGTMFDVNVAGTAAAVEIACVAGAKAIVYAGSCSEYGKAEPDEPIDENHPLNAMAPYGASKAAGGLWGRAVAGAFRVPFQWMRVFGVFGPGEAAHRLIPAIVAKVTRAEPVALSPGDQVRDFLYVDDAAEGLIMAARAGVEGLTGPFNLCSGEPVTVKQMALAVADALGQSRSLLNFGATGYRPDETLWLVGRPNRFRASSGFAPRRSLSEGIVLTLAALGVANGR